VRVFQASLPRCTGDSFACCCRTPDAAPRRWANARVVFQQKKRPRRPARSDPATRAAPCPLPSSGTNTYTPLNLSDKTRQKLLPSTLQRSFFLSTPTYRTPFPPSSPEMRAPRRCCGPWPGVNARPHPQTPLVTFFCWCSPPPPPSLTLSCPSPKYPAPPSQWPGRGCPMMTVCAGA
jgi:hypothetical protein